MLLSSLYKKGSNNNDEQTSLVNSNNLLDESKTITNDEEQIDRGLSNNDSLFNSCIKSNFKNEEYHSAKRSALRGPDSKKSKCSGQSRESVKQSSGTKAAEDFIAVQALLNLQRGTDDQTSFTNLYDSFLVNQYEYNKSKYLKLDHASNSKNIDKTKDDEV